MKLKINVYGDKTYISPSSSNKEIKLSLKRFHYTPYVKNETRLITIRKYRNFPIVMYNSTHNNEIYDGESIKVLNERQISDIYFGRTLLYVKNTSNLPLEQAYEQYINDANLLLKESDGLINLYRHNTLKSCALELFERLTRRTQKAEAIEEHEAIWIKECTMGALFYADKEYRGYGKKIDIKSQYPYLLKQSTNKFPIKKGEFLHLDELPEILQYGIYHCRIVGDDIDGNKLFRFNKNNRYTAIDIRRARELNLTIELIQDGEANCLYYSRDKLITGIELFGPYIDLLYPMKKKGIKTAKLLLNILWGALCQKNIIQRCVSNKPKVSSANNDYVIESDSIISNLAPSLYDEDTTVIQTFKHSHLYVTDYARICPFLLSMLRNMTSKIVEKYNDNVVWVHTDGFILNKPIKINTGVEIGDLHMECHGYCYVIE